MIAHRGFDETLWQTVQSLREIAGLLARTRALQRRRGDWARLIAAVKVG